MVPKVVFHNDVNAQANYLCYLAKQIACGWYQERRFLILPKLVTGNPQTIYFPNLNYSSQFWAQFEKYSKDDFDFFYPKEKDSIALDKLGLQNDDGDIEKQWREKERGFFATLADVLPKFDLSKINKIDCLISPFGTVSSFYFEHKANKYNFYHTLRADFGPAQLAESIISQFLWTQQPTPKLSLWYQIEAITDLLMAQSKIGKIFNYEYAPTLTKMSENFVLESKAYLEKLGFPVKSLPINCRFTPTEKRIFDGLMANKGQIVTYDQIGNWFWQENSLEKYSLYSIAKIMEKIRKKIKDQGIYQELIYTVRGQGYVVYD